MAKTKRWGSLAPGDRIMHRGYAETIQSVHEPRNDGYVPVMFASNSGAARRPHVRVPLVREATNV